MLGSWIVPPSNEIIDDENSRKTTDSMKIQFLICYSDKLEVPGNYVSSINSLMGHVKYHWCVKSGFCSI
jgi:hypothetical protein